MGSDVGPSILTSDGAFDLFVSEVPDLVPGITITGEGAFVRNMSTGQTTLVSVNNTGTDTGNQGVLPNDLTISSNGRYVTWISESTDILASGVTDSDTDIYKLYLTDLQTGTTIAIPGAGGVVATGVSFSPDSSSLLFSSTATNLVPAITNPSGSEQLYLRNLATGTTQMVSVDPTGTTAGNSDSADGGQFSGNGQFVLFASNATNLVPGGGGGQRGLFLRNLTTGSTQLVATGAGAFAAGQLRWKRGSLQHRRDHQQRGHLHPEPHRPQHADRGRQSGGRQRGRDAAGQWHHQLLAVEAQTVSSWCLRVRPPIS